jgi:hypothetical protein
VTLLERESALEALATVERLAHEGAAGGVLERETIL